MRSFHLLLSALCLSALLSACGGGIDIQGPPDESAAPATPGAPAAPSSPTDPLIGLTQAQPLLSVRAEWPGAHCANGGLRIEVGPDSDGNGALDAGEPGSTQYLCPMSAAVSATLVRMSDEPAGGHCAAGGKAIGLGVDANGNGQLDAAEQSSSAYLCNGFNGKRFDNTANSLASITTEAAGAACSSGGHRLDVGADSNGNGVLDADEVGSTQHLCQCAGGWADASATAVQASSNACYVARNGAAPVVVTLPLNPAIGDIVRVQGSGAGGWRIAQNAGQSVQTGPLGGQAGARWTPHESDQSWYGLASSADGLRLVASAYGEKVYTSSDGGLNWTPRDVDRSWMAVASSSDGRKLVAVTDGDRIYTSDDSGLSWTPRDDARRWSAVASSADGSRLVAVVAFGQIYTSIDSGVSWTPRDAARNWYAVASSADGRKLVASELNGKLYTSSDSGVSWTPRESDRSWYSVASSADGSKLVAADHNGRLYTSSDSGVSWTPRESERAWTFVASSADGSKLVAVVANGPIFTSSDSGETWTEHNADQPDWIAVTSSADGSRLVASADGGAIYTSVATTTPGVGGWISGAAGDAIELQYLGGGMFAVKDRVGMPGFQ